MLSEREVNIVPVRTFMEAAVESLIGFNSEEELMMSLKKGLPAQAF